MLWHEGRKLQTFGGVDTGIRPRRVDRCSEEWTAAVHYTAAVHSYITELQHYLPTFLVITQDHCGKYIPSYCARVYTVQLNL